MSDATYQTKIYMQRGGDALIVKEGGEVNIADQDIAKAEVIGQGATSTVFSVVNLPKSKFITLSMTSTCVNPSFWLTSCLAGAEVFLQQGQGSCASGVIDVSLSGCTLLGSLGVAINSFEMHNSAASACRVHLVAMKDNVWSIVSEDGNITG